MMMMMVNLCVYEYYIGGNSDKHIYVLKFMKKIFEGE